MAEFGLLNQFVAVASSQIDTNFAAPVVLEGMEQMLKVAAFQEEKVRCGVFYRNPSPKTFLSHISAHLVEIGFWHFHDAVGAERVFAPHKGVAASAAFWWREERQQVGAQQLYGLQPAHTLSGYQSVYLPQLVSVFVDFVVVDSLMVDAVGAHTATRRMYDSVAAND